MGTTNTLDLNNRVTELAGSYPADKVMMSDGVTSVEDALDALQIKSVTFNETTSSSGRITNKFAGMEIIVLKANCYEQSHIVIPYTYENANIINTGFKILNSEGMSAVVNTAVQLKVYYIEL